jgi:hypothetical protein
MTLGRIFEKKKQQLKVMKQGVMLSSILSNYLLKLKDK